MPSFFRFAIQTLSERHSEVWSFYGNNKQGCLYANRASMSGWLKISFHGSGFCHIKARDSPDAQEEREHAWRVPEADGTRPVHLMRMIYDLNRQRASLPRDDRVKVMFETWGGVGSVHLNVYAGPVGEAMTLPEGSTTIGDFSLGMSRRIVFALEIGPPQLTVPEPLSGMALHWDPSEDSEQAPSRLKNMMAVWYSAPEQAGTLTLMESTVAEFVL